MLVLDVDWLRSSESEVARGGQQERDDERPDTGHRASGGSTAAESCIDARRAAARVHCDNLAARAVARADGQLGHAALPRVAVDGAAAQTAGAGI